MAAAPLIDSSKIAPMLIVFLQIDFPDGTFRLFKAEDDGTRDAWIDAICKAAAIFAINSSKGAATPVMFTDKAQTPVKQARSGGAGSPSSTDSSSTSPRSQLPTLPSISSPSSVASVEANLSLLSPLPMPFSPRADDLVDVEEMKDSPTTNRDSMAETPIGVFGLPGSDAAQEEVLVPAHRTFTIRAHDVGKRAKVPAWQ